MDLVSVIVPIYNSEKYLNECIDSISNQSYRNLEIILIDDGSTDGSRKIIEKWKIQDKRIKVVEQENSGVAKARNKGIEVAKGKYICFFDSDDWVEKDMILEMQKEMSSRNCDMVYSNFCYEYTSSLVRGIDVNNEKEIIEKKWDGCDFYFHYLSPSSCSGFVTNKMFRLDIIHQNSLRYSSKLVAAGEDSLFNLCYFANVKKTIFINKTFYHYMQRENSRIRKEKAEMINNYADLIIELIEYLEAQSYKGMEKIIPHLFYHYYTLAIETVIRNKLKKEAIINHMKRVSNDLLFRNLMEKYVESQLSRDNHFGGLSRRIRTIVFAKLFIYKQDGLILSLSEKWIYFKKANESNNYGLYKNIDLKISPLISIIMPVYNCEKYIEESIKSVRNQTYKNWELIIIEDDSTDKSLSIIKDISQHEDRIKIYENSNNMGAVFSRNKGIENSKGEWVAFLDSDDMWSTQKLEIQLEEVKKSNSKFIFSDIHIQKDGCKKVTYIANAPKKIQFDYLKKQNVIPLSTVIIHKSLLKNEKFERDDLHEDYILWLKILSKGNSAYLIDKPLTTIQIRKGSKSSKKLQSVIKSYKVYRYIGLSRKESIKNTLSNSIRAVKKYLHFLIYS